MAGIRVPVKSRGERAFPPPIKGQVQFVTHESRVLDGNPLNDPTHRPLAVYTPPSGRTEGLPLLVLLSGFTGSGWLHFPPGARYLTEPLTHQLERFFRTGQCGEAVIVAPDGVTSLGGSQYLNSSATGRYEDYVVEEIVPWAREHYGTAATGIFGHSSGGYGALVLGMRHPDVFQGILASSPDAAFEYAYLPEVPKAVRTFREFGGPEPFLTRLFTDPPIPFSSSHRWAPALNQLAMASCYSPLLSEPGAFELPFDWETGELLETVWERWLAWDPIRMIKSSEPVRALGAMRTLIVGAGKADEWGLDVSGHRFLQALRAKGLPHLEERLYEGGHFETWPHLIEDTLPLLIRGLQESSGPSPP